MPKAPFSLLLASLFAMGAIAGGARAQGTPAAATTPAGVGDRPVASGGTFTPMDPSTELLHSDKARLTRGDYDTQLERLPENTRAGFGTNIDRINTLLRVMLVDKTLAAQAREREYPTYAQLGQFTVPTALRKNVKGLLTAPAITFWNIEKG